MEDSIGAGNVLDRSQISTSFLILGCREDKLLAKLRLWCCVKHALQAEDVEEAYLLVIWCRADDIVHQRRKQFSDSMNTSSKSTIGGA